MFDYLTHVLIILQGGAGDGRSQTGNNFNGSELSRLNRLRMRNDRQSETATDWRNNILTRVRYRRCSSNREKKAEHNARKHWLDADPAYSVEGVVQSCEAAELYARTLGKKTALWMEFSRLMPGANK